MFKAKYSSDGAIYEDVMIVGWDRCKYFAFYRIGNDSQDICEDKCWKFDIKFTNKIYQLPEYHFEYDLDGVADAYMSTRPTKKQIAKELHQRKQKHKTVYTVFTRDSTHVYPTLKKAVVAFCKYPDSVLRKDSDKKYSGFSRTLMYKDESTNDLFYFEKVPANVLKYVLQHSI